MTGYAPPIAFLRRTASESTDPPALHSLKVDSEVFIGRDPLCAIFFDSSAANGGISRQHAKIRANAGSWQICDLSSANGTYINGQRIQGCQTLQNGDRITLGQGEPQLVFEAQPVVAAQSSHTAIAIPPAAPAPDSVTFSQLFPIVSTGNDLARKAFLIPGIVTVSFVVLLFLSIGNSAVFNPLLATYLVGAAYYFVYQLCGKPKPWWLLIGVAATTALVLASPLLDWFIWVFRQVLPGSVPPDYQSIPFPVLLVRMFFGAGLMEELLKALPVLLLAGLGTMLKRSPQREQLGVWEPLDGILLGTASAVGFTLMETLGQYVPSMVSESGQLGELQGLQLLIPRILGAVSGHMAYSGYFGYFIGLSLLKPSRRWRILSVGYLSAAALHALWNSTGAINVGVLMLVGMLSYAFLAAAILKARALSPTRSQNFATRFTRLR